MHLSWNQVPCRSWITCIAVFSIENWVIGIRTTIVEICFGEWTWYFYLWFLTIKCLRLVVKSILSWCVSDLQICWVWRTEICLQKWHIVLDIGSKKHNILVKIVDSWPRNGWVVVPIVSLVNNVLSVTLSVLKSIGKITVDNKWCNAKSNNNNRENQKRSHHGSDTADIVGGVSEFISTAPELIKSYSFPQTLKQMTCTIVATKMIKVIAAITYKGADRGLTARM